MPLENERIAYTRQWLEKVRKDLRSAELVLAASPPETEDAPFHCQQAVEKALKAFLVWHDQPFRKVHNIGELGKQCVEIDPGLEPLLDRAASLTEYAWAFRYPGDRPEPDLDEAEQSLVLARELVKAILAGLPAEARL